MITIQSNSALLSPKFSKLSKWFII